LLIRGVGSTIILFICPLGHPPKIYTYLYISFNFSLFLLSFVFALLSVGITKNFVYMPFDRWGNTEWKWKMEWGLSRWAQEHLAFRILPFNGGYPANAIKTFLSCSRQIDYS